MLLVEPDAGGQTRTATMTLPRGADNDIGSAPSIEPRLRACQGAMDEKLFPEASRCAAWRQEASGRQEKGSIPDAVGYVFRGRQRRRGAVGTQRRVCKKNSARRFPRFGPDWGPKLK